MSTLYMFPPNERPTEDADILAGEYVLGVMDAGEAAATRLRADTDPSLLGAIGTWQARLAVMTEMLPESTVPAQLWTRLATEIGMPDLTRPNPEPEPPAPEPPAPEPPAPEPPAPEPEAIATAAAAAEPAAAETPHPPVYEPAPIPPAEPAAPEAKAPDMPAEAPPSAGPEPDAAIFIPPEPPVPPVAETHPQPSPEAPSEAPPASSAAPGTALLPAISPPAHIPPRAEPSVPAVVRPASPGLPRWADRLIVWRIATAACLALAIAIGLAAVLGRPSFEKAVAAIGVVNAPAPLYLAEADSRGNLRITPLAIIAVPNGRDLELWMIPPNAADARSLGVLPPSGRTVSLGGAPIEGTRFVVSMEPRGGSPSGHITGQVLYGGTLANR